MTLDAVRLARAALLFLALPFFPMPVLADEENAVLLPKFSPMDRYTKPLLAPGEVLVEQLWSHFQNDLSATASSPLGTTFEQKPHLETLDTRLVFLLPNRVETDLRLRQSLPSEYEQKNPNTTSPSTGKFANDSMYDCSLGFKKRFEGVEIHSQFNGMDMNGSDAQELIPPSLSSRTITAVHFLDHRYGLSYLSSKKLDTPESELSGLRGPLLPKKDIFIELEAGYQNGRVNQGWTGLAGILSRSDTNYQRKLETVYWGSARVTYGLREDLQVKSGVFLSTPMDIFSEWLNDNRLSTARQAQVRSRTDGYVEIPLEARYRPAENVEAYFSANTIFARQKASGLTRIAGGATPTVRPDREVEYWNTKPRAEVNWLLNPSPSSRGDYAERFEALTQKFLKKNEALVSLSYERDVTHLENGQEHGLTGFTRPSSLFSRTLQRHFFYGTEYSLRQDLASFVHVDGYGTATFQNDNRLNASWSYGFTDDFNVSFLTGYRSGSAAHIDVLPWTTPTSNPEGWETESFVTKPYYYFEFGADWKIRENMILSFSSHWVPFFELVQRNSTDGGVTTDIESSYLETLLALTLLC